MQQYFLLALLLVSSFSLRAQLAPEPTAQPTNLFADGTVKAYTFDIRFDPSGADGYLVLRSTQPITTPPSDGTAYDKGEGLGTAKVFSNSISSFVRVKEVVANTPYYFAVYAFNIDNNNPATINYLTTSPLTATITSGGKDYGNYYSSIDFSSPQVLSSLKNLINPHTQVSYDDYKSTIIADFFERDTVGGQKVVNCQYSNELKIYTGAFDFVDLNYSREHRMAFSWINFSGISRSQFEDTPEGCDLHSLDLVQNTVNTQRSNRPFSSDFVSTSSTYIDFRIGRDSNNKDVAEVREDRRGDVARAMFYMIIAYNGKYASNWGLDNLLSDAENQVLQQLLDWHANDPVDNFEIARHEYVYAQQNNRNPFVDYPELVNCIDFTDVTLKTSCGYVGITEPTQTLVIKAYPQPANNHLYLNIETTKPFIGNLKVFDLTGRQLMQISAEAYTGPNTIEIPVGDLKSGYYVYLLDDGVQQHQGKFVVAR